MKKIFQVQKKTITYREVIWSLLRAIPVVIFWCLLMNSMSLSKLDFKKVLAYIVIAVIGIICRILLDGNKKRLESICYNNDEEKLTITHYKIFGTTIKTVFNRKDLKISEIIPTPFASAAFSNYFILEDENSNAKVSTSEFDLNIMDIKEMHQKLAAIIAS